MPFDVSTLQYVELNDYRSESLLRVKYLHDFLSILEKKKSDVLYRCRNDDGASDFIFPAGGVTFVFNTFGYKTISDLLKGNQLGFAGCEKKFDSYRASNSTGARFALEEGDVYYKAMKLGYDNLPEFEKAVSKGFGNVDSEKYRAALGGGFMNYDDYVAAKEMNLDHDASLFFEAKEMGLSSEKEIETYSRLKSIRDQQHFDTLDKALLFEILSRRGSGPPSRNLEEICAALQAEKPKRDFGVTPRWYSQSFDDDVEKLEDFLSNNPSVAKLGSYTPGTRIFKKYPEMSLPPMETSSLLQAEYVGRDEREKSKNSRLNWQMRD